MHDKILMNDERTNDDERSCENMNYVWFKHDDFYLGSANTCYANNPIKIKQNLEKIFYLLLTAKPSEV